MDIVFEEYNCSWPGCNEKTSGPKGIGDMNWEFRNNGKWNACPKHKTKTTKEFAAARHDVYVKSFTGDCI